MKNTIKNWQLFVCTIAICVCTVLSAAVVIQHYKPYFPKSYYAQVFKVIESREKFSDYRNILLLEDYEGNQIEIYSDKYEIGDCVVCILDKKGTISIEDDVVYDDFYGGEYYTPLEMEEEIKNAHEVDYDKLINIEDEIDTNDKLINIEYKKGE